MFEATGSEQSLALRASFWQWFKAGAGFALGAILIAVPVSVLLYFLWLRVFIAIIARL